ncbi:DUF962 domain-containing protein [Kangiella sp. HZ709]|uniref:Mpo1 family 2-hydroxy fatty acid dioxygenase n=1 Tax=Kangiella sp. HZ709 TaxID=2666328 RepID=UPI0012B15C38|nr:Mpo1-like protein [Kangiella sp. HZ709]MRX28574.1 DUF962 domain-containing protein [Kangiella sp. HZ709]
MKSGHQWIAEYSESHRNPTNKLIHWVCVPVIVWTVIALLWSIPVPEFMQMNPWLNWASLFMLLAMFFYFTFGFKIFFAMLLMAVGMLWFTAWLSQATTIPVWQIAVVAFIIAWVGQFIGHHIEGKKPSFMKDVQFLLVGPAWEINYLFRKIGFIK